MQGLCVHKILKMLKSIVYVILLSTNGISSVFNSLKLINFVAAINNVSSAVNGRMPMKLYLTSTRNTQMNLAVFG